MRFTITFCILWAFQGWGQQLPQYSQYIRNQYMVNPGATGAEDFVSINLGGRLQWLGVDGAPQTSYLYFAAPVSKLNGASMKRTYGKVRRHKKSVKHPKIHRAKLNHSYGAHLLADQYGPYRTLKIMGAYAIHLPLSRNYKLSFGANLGLSSRAFMPEKAQVLSSMTDLGYSDATYATYTGNRGSQYVMDLNAGLYFYGKGLFAGVSANQLTKDFVKFGNTMTNFSPRMHFYFTGGYKFPISRKMTMTPALLIKYVKPAPVSFEGTVQFDYLEKFWFGFSYRHQDAIVAMIGASIKDKFRVGYSYDFSISKFNKVSSGGHELVLGLMLGKTSRSMARY